MRTLTHPQIQTRQKQLLIILMVAGISSFHLLMPRTSEQLHIFARELYFLPIILGAFWFGLRGSVVTSLTVTLFYLPYSIVHWRGFVADDLDRLLEIALFNIVAVLIGLLQDKQRARTREKFDSIKALTATVAHEINSPLFVAMGTLDLLQDDIDKDSETYREITTVMKSLDEMKVLVKKISSIEEVVTSDYDGTSRIVDLEKSMRRQ